MKVLIIGAKGMLGGMLSQVFSQHKPTLWDKEDIDITNLNQVQELLYTEMPEVVINAAAYTNVDGAETDREAAFAVNELGVKNVARIAKELEAKLVHYSTDYVFPGTKETGYSEDELTGPAVNVYGESKLAGEKILQEINPHYYLLRTAWLYGPGGKNFVDTMISLADKGTPLKVVNDQFGSPTFTKDLADATFALVEGGRDPGIYHTVNTGKASWYEFAQEIFRLTNKKVEVIPVSSDEYVRPAKRPKYSMLKNTKGPSMRPWQEALQDYLTSYHS